jgi:hypothetical protein
MTTKKKNLAKRSKYALAIFRALLKHQQGVFTEEAINAALLRGASHSEALKEGQDAAALYVYRETLNETEQSVYDSATIIRVDSMINHGDAFKDGKAAVACYRKYAKKIERLVEQFSCEKHYIDCVEDLSELCIF